MHQRLTELPLSPPRLLDYAKALARLTSAGHEIAWVSSGAVAAGPAPAPVLPADDPVRVASRAYLHELRQTLP